MECPCSEHGGEAVFPGTAYFHIFSRGAAGAIDTTGKMKPLGGGSVRRVAVGHRTPVPGCQPRQGRKSKVAKSGTTDYSLVGLRAIEWRPWVAASDRQTLFMEPCVGEE
jgi:hypothetical protein